MLLLIAYLLGSIPTAQLVGRRYGLDMRVAGNGNIGSKNVFHQAGLWPGVFVGAADVTKGALAIWLAKWSGASETLLYLTGLAAVLGHDFPIFLRFHGGQGMATALGVLGTLQPFEVAIGVVVALASLRFTGNWNLSWSIGLGIVPVNAWAFGRSPQEVWYTIVVLPTVGLKKMIDMTSGIGMAHRRT